MDSVTISKIWPGVRFHTRLGLVRIVDPVPLRSLSAMSAYATQDSSSSSSDVLRAADLSRSGPGASSPGQVPTANDLLMAAYDPAKLHPLAGLGDKLDYLLLDDDKTNELPGSGTAIPSRGWSDDLCYGTGTMYLSGTSRSLSDYSICTLFFSLRTSHVPCASLTLSRHLRRTILGFFIVMTCHMFILLFPGLTLGGLWGLQEGARRPLAVSNTRLRINSVLNSVTRRGTFIGNSAGVMGTCTLFHSWNSP